jgi:hypothetical protein
VTAVPTVLLNVFMKYLLFFHLLLLTACVRERERTKHKFTVNFHDYRPNGCTCDLYGEVYTLYGFGAFGSDVNAEYLTDSVHFRVRLGTYDEGNEMIVVKCHGDTVRIVKTFKRNDKSGYDTLERRQYSLRVLKESRRFEE